MTDISIIIVNYNGSGFIEDCLSSIERTLSSVKGDISYDVIIVDNASSDRSPDYIDNFCRSNIGFSFVKNNHNTGFGSASNKGARQSGGRFLLFLNPDCKLIEEGLEDVLDFYKKQGNAGVLGARILNNDGSLQLSCRAVPSLARQLYESYFCSRIFSSNRIFGSYFMSWWDHNTPRAVDWLSGSFMLIDRKKFEETGGFSKDYFMYSEDTDLCLMLSRKGYKNYYYPYYTVQHADAAIASRDPAAREAQIWQSRRIYFRKNHSRLHAPILSFIYFSGMINRIIIFGLGSIFLKGARKRLSTYIKTLCIYFRKK